MLRQIESNTHRPWHTSTTSKSTRDVLSWRIGLRQGRQRTPTKTYRMQVGQLYTCTSYKKAVLSQGEPRDAAVNFYTHRS